MPALAVARACQRGLAVLQLSRPGFRGSPVHETGELHKTLGASRAGQPTSFEQRGSFERRRDWWAEVNELHHHVSFPDQQRPAALRAWRPVDPIACAWDLSVIAFERTAWVREVLANPDGPDLDAYLAAQLNEAV